jgi:hypothetical protein
MPGPLARDRIIAPPGFNRWFVPPASIAIHLCIGSVYAWSMFDPARFAEKFGAPVGKLKELVNAETVTISKLMKISPAGTQNPTPTLYNTTMFLMAALLAVALVCNILIRPVDPKHFTAENSA